MSARPARARRARARPRARRRAVRRGARAAAGGDAVADAVLGDVARAAAEVGIERRLAPRRRELARRLARSSLVDRASRARARLGLARRAIVVGSIALPRLARARMVAPWIMVDELVYSELAKSFAAGARFLVRDVPAHGYGVVYPLLIAPGVRALRLGARRLRGGEGDQRRGDVARGGARVLARAPAAADAAGARSRRLLAVACRRSLYTGTLMTENAFYPLFLSSRSRSCAMLERPTRGASSSLLAASRARVRDARAGGRARRRPR